MSETTHQHGKTLLARQLFLFGDGDGRPVTALKTLAKRTGCSECNLARRVPEWTEEREDLLRASSTINLDISAETMRKHAEDVAFLRERADALEAEVETSDEIAQGLRDALLDAGGGDHLHKLLNSFIKTALSSQKATTQWLAVQKRWVESSGVESKLKAFSASETEKARAKARLSVKSEEPEVKLVTSEPPHGVFARRSDAR